MRKKKEDAAENAAEAAGTEAPAPVFTKAQILNSKTFSTHKDMLSVVLQEDKCYTLEEAEESLRKFKERKVK